MSTLNETILKCWDAPWATPDLRVDMLRDHIACCPACCDLMSIGWGPRALVAAMYPDAIDERVVRGDLTETWREVMACIGLPNELGIPTRRTATEGWARRAVRRIPMPAALSEA